MRGKNQSEGTAFIRDVVRLWLHLALLWQAGNWWPRQGCLAVAVLSQLSETPRAMDKIEWDLEHKKRDTGHSTVTVTDRRVQGHPWAPGSDWEN